MAAILFLADDERERECVCVKQNESVSRSKTSLDCLDDVEVIKRHRIPRKFLVQLVELVKRTWRDQPTETLAFGLNPGM